MLLGLDNSTARWFLRPLAADPAMLRNQCALTGEELDAWEVAGRFLDEAALKRDLRRRHGFPVCLQRLICENVSMEALQVMPVPPNMSIDMQVVKLQICTALQSAAANELHYASSNPNEPSRVVELLLEAGVNKDMPDADGSTALMLAARADNVNATQRLLRAAANTELRDRRGATALTIATRNGRAQIVRLLLEARASIGEQSLIWAAKEGHAKIVKLLLKHGADRNVPDTSGITALVHAADYGHSTVMQLLLGVSDLDLNLRLRSTALLYAAERGLVGLARSLLQAGHYEKSHKSHRTHTAPMVHVLIYAALEEHTDIVPWTARDGALKHLQREHCRHTAHFLASDGSNAGCGKMLRYVLDAGGVKHLQRLEGHTAVSLAASNGDLQILKLLLEAGFDKDLQDESGGDTALICAARMAHVEALRLLAAVGANPNLCNSNGYVPLKYAAELGDVLMLEVLLGAGANPDFQHLQDGSVVDTALICAARGGHAEVTQKLIEADSDLNLPNSYRDTPLIYAADRGHLSVVHVLLKALADANLQSCFHKTALMHAADKGHKEIVEQLLEAGADKKARDAGGLTARKLAFCKGHEEIVELLDAS